MKNIDDFDSIMSSWKSFEYTYGSVDQIRECADICDKIIDNYNRKMYQKRENVEKAPKRKAETEADEKTPKKKQKPTEASTSTSNKNDEARKNKRSNPFLKKDEQKPVSNDNDNVKIFLSNLSFEITEEQIKTALPELNIQNVDLVKSPGGKNRGFAYLVLSNEIEVEKALRFDRRLINGRPVFITKVLRDKSSRTTFKYAEGKNESRIFVKGLPFDATKEELEILFGKYGKIEDIRMITKK